jgi:predicted nucleic acid-binding Zn ribbon protein
MADASLVDCPSCGEPELKRLLSAPRFRLKGKGWYETDFKTGDKRNIAGDTETKKVDKKDKSAAKSKSAPDKKSTA